MPYSGMCRWPPLTARRITGITDHASKLLPSRWYGSEDSRLMTPEVHADEADSRQSGSTSATASLAATSTSGKVCATRSEEHTSEIQSLMRISYAVFCLKKKK